MTLRFLYTLLALLLLAAACGDRTPVIEQEPDRSTLVKENMINANRVVIQSETTQIDAYLRRRGWTVRQLPCGASYRLDHDGSGPQVLPNDTVRVAYRLEALDGTPFYTHQVDTLVVGRRQPTVALDDMLQQLRYGSRAHLIAPSNSAYGVVGDGDRVASRTVLVYVVSDIAKIHNTDKNSKQVKL